LALADGRYLARGGAAGEEESVLVVETLGAPGPARRRRRPRGIARDENPAELPLTRVTAIRAFAPFAGEAEAERWLDEATEAPDTAEVLAGEGTALLNRALHAHAVAASDPRAVELAPEDAAVVRLGYGSGDQTAGGDFAAAREIDMREVASRRKRRQEDLRPQERVAAVLGGRERADVCETLLLRARADLDAGRDREAALQLRVGFEALVVELRGALADPGHDRDMGTLNERRREVGEAANAALGGELTSEQLRGVRELLEIAERVLRRRRVLRG
jgi:hypothetical protein